MNLFTKQKQTDSQRMNLWLPGARKGRRDREFEMDVYSHCYIQNVEPQEPIV